jgi:hypothetical protein
MIRVAIIILSCIIGLPITCYAQIDTTKLLFTETFYFEDARGNKDTVHLSGSSFANGNSNPHLGEINISEVPFDSVFEARIVRIADLYDRSHRVNMMAKHYVADLSANSKESLCNSGLTTTGFVVYAKYPPITLKWDTTAYNEGVFDCFPGSFINNTLAHDVYMQWYSFAGPGYYDYACLRGKGEHVFKPFTDPWSHDPHDGYIIASIFTEGGVRSDTIDAYSFNIDGFGFGPCKDIGVSASEPGGTLAVQVVASPNPVTDQLRFDVPADLVVSDIKVYSATGQLVLTAKEGSEPLYVGALAAGIYFSRIEFADGQLATVRFVKQ